MQHLSAFISIWHTVLSDWPAFEPSNFVSFCHDVRPVSVHINSCHTIPLSVPGGRGGRSTAARGEDPGGVISSLRCSNAHGLAGVSAGLSLLRVP